MYPANQNDANGGKGLPKSPGTSYQYTVVGTDYNLSGTSGLLAFHISSLSGGMIEDGVWSGHTAPGGGTVWKQLAGGYSFACAIGTDSKAYCWGDNGSGQLGDNTTTPRSIPTAVNTTGVLAGKTIKYITAGSNNTCAIASDNLVYCWGYNAYGELGNNSTTDSSVPIAVNTAGVLNGKTIKSVATGIYNTCVIASDDKAYCWGLNNAGQLGNNSTTQSLVPVAVDTTGSFSGKTVKTITVGEASVCAIASDNLAYCWGDNGSGRLGNTDVGQKHSPFPVNTAGVLNGKTILSISTSANHVCVIASDNLAYCWGRNQFGVLGNATFTDSNVPVAVNTAGVLAGKTILSIDTDPAVYYGTCVVASDNQAYCWGMGWAGALGNNSGSNSNVPVAVDTSGVLAGKTIKSLSSGVTFSCVVASDNNTYCWGYNGQYQLGNNSTTNSSVPVAMTAIP